MPLEPSTSPPGTSRRSLLLLLALTGWGLALGLAHSPLLLSGLSQVQGDEGDVRFVHFILEHGYRFLRQDAGHERLWDMPLFHPARNTGAYSEVLLGVMPFYALWRAAGAAPDTAYALWVLTLTSLNFLAALGFLAWGFRVHAGAAVVGAVLFAAGASRINQANHPQLLAQFYCLLAVGAALALARAESSRRQGVGWAALLVAASVAQLYACFYWGWFLGFLLLLAALAALASRTLRPQLLGRLRVHGPALVLFGALGGLALWPLVDHSLAAVREVGLRSFEEAGGMVPRFASWFHLGDSSWLYGWSASLDAFRRLPVEGEHRLGLGLLTSALAGLGLWRARQRPAIWVMLAVTVTVILLSTRYRGGLMPWWLVFHSVPGAGAIRAISRVGIWLLLPASVGLALWLSRQREEGRWGRAALAAGLCLLEQGGTWATFDVREARADVRRLASLVGPGCQTFLYTPAGGDSPSWKYQMDAAWAALERGVPTVNGYSGNVPPGWALEPILRATPEDARRLDAALQAWAHARGLDEARICRIDTRAPR